MRRTTGSVCVQRTGLAACRASALRIAAGVAWDATSTLWTTGIAGVANATPSSRCASRSAAGLSSELWNGAETGSNTARRAPRAFAATIARSTAARLPAITSCPGAL